MDLAIVRPFPATNFVKALVMEVIFEEIIDRDWEIRDVECNREP